MEFTAGLQGQARLPERFAVLLVLLTLVGVSLPAGRKPKIHRESIAGRREAFLPVKTVAAPVNRWRHYLQNRITNSLFNAGVL